MKPAPGTVTIVATGPEGSTTVTATITETGLSMGSETYVWAPAFDMFVGEHVDATLRFVGPQSGGTIQGSTGLPPNQRTYTGTWSRS